MITFEMSSKESFSSIGIPLLMILVKSPSSSTLLPMFIFITLFIYSLLSLFTVVVGLIGSLYLYRPLGRGLSRLEYFSGRTADWGGSLRYVWPLVRCASRKSCPDVIFLIIILDGLANSLPLDSVLGDFK